ncbi:hypothetical protein FHS19_000001 [Paenibacillus rhizosphaerae]|uniref:AraC-type arabinose-binding/dimerisation domain-containing protein n=1 Tax=Paenibacillus rhizosphaerae TaxID=297318 RepID=A0A839TKJ1_9BACL|nr:AraC family ligand binding domain-containing protein [Paenibacillus rhizosphaerae]MBB3125347.1 hypothetical protein [Paenibacillus rhizosphaerae]
MSFVAGSYGEVPPHFAYKRKSVNYEHKETFHSNLGAEVLLIHQCRGTMIVNNNRYDIKPGMLCIFQPYQLHHLKLDYAEDQCFERSLAIFEPTMFESYFEKWPSLYTFYKFIYLGKLPFPCLYENSEEDGFNIIDSVYKSLNDRLPALSETERNEEFSLFLIALFRWIKQVWEKWTEPGQPIYHALNHTGPLFYLDGRIQVETMISYLPEAAS